MTAPSCADRLSSREQRLSSAIASRAATLLADLRLHVALPTGGGNTAALDENRRRLTERLGVLGAEVSLIAGEPKPAWLHGVSPNAPIPPAAVCRHERPNLRPILLSGHLDTVHDPAGPFRELTISADGRTATGPGCVDMKGGLVILVAALEALEEAGIAVSWTVILNSDEETGSYHSEAALRAEAQQAAAAGGVGLVVEPALPGGELVTSRAGSGQFLIETRGRGAHVGRDFTSGVSAVNALARAVVAASEIPDPTRGLIVNIGPLEGGQATNVVPESARAWGNVRFPNAAGADDLGRRLDALATAEGDLPAVTIRRSFNRPAKPLTPAVERLALLARSAAENLGQKLPFASTGGVCDGNILQGAGLPTIDTLGVRGGGLHTPREWIELPSLVERCQLLAVLIARIAEGRWNG